MTKEKLITVLRKDLNTQESLDFLLELCKEELERLVAIVKERIE